jgi:hypothetical protein
MAFRPAYPWKSITTAIVSKLCTARFRPGNLVFHFYTCGSKTIYGVKCFGARNNMSKNLYVGNLSYSVNDSELYSLFAQYGKVDSARVITDRETNRSKGFGFVEMTDDAEAEAAINALNGQENNGRTLTVNEAKPREPRTFRPRGGMGNMSR